ncbi:diacylglycerol kinase [Halomonas icarae]|uniref:Diacylglycerol kinase n=1 Tax=Halomonas icarae TaxID=2691040 RepID=A0A7X4W1N6_9GAMM|nr:diacylglycerol kinase [Halomonas icarae]MDR5903379.1 diacylglycerol kinase [Halomonas icarae]NAW14261.1 diacylglycerol kinase [Halomonas icarae]
MKPGHTGWRHLVHSTRYSIKGMKAAWFHEAAFRQELVLFLLLLPLAGWLGDGPVDWILLLGSGLVVLAVELLNSAIESIVDRIGPEHHELSGRAKDLGSAAVMVSLLLAGLTWLLLLGQKLFG